jgi:hypothetical protein
MDVTTDTKTPPVDPIFATFSQTLAMGVSFLVLAALMTYLLVALWPERATPAPDNAGANAAVAGPGQRGAGDKPLWDETASVFGVTFRLRFETRLILLVIVAGALGSYVHGATSFATYVGNRTLFGSWIWWYVLRTPIGVSLAVLFYFVVRGGLLSAGANGDSLSPFGVAAIAGLVGMFSKQATDKLRELFDNLFRTAPGRGDDERKDKPEKKPVPVLKAMTPTSVPSKGGETTIKVVGEDFDETSLVLVNGTKRPTRFVSATELAVTLDATDIANPATFRLMVVTPPPGGGSSDPLELTVT